MTKHFQIIDDYHDAFECLVWARVGPGCSLISTTVDGRTCVVFDPRGNPTMQCWEQ